MPGLPVSFGALSIVFFRRLLSCKFEWSGHTTHSKSTQRKSICQEIRDIYLYFCLDLLFYESESRYSVTHTVAKSVCVCPSSGGITRPFTYVRYGTTCTVPAIGTTYVCSRTT